MSVLEVAPRGLSGRKGGSGGSPKQTPDNLFSTDLVEALFGVSEGPILGLKEGAKSFLVGDTPLEASDGNPNFDNFELIIREGSLLGEDIQPRLGGFGSSTSVNTELTTGVPVNRQGLHKNFDFLDVRLVVNRLLKSTNKGTFNHTGVVKIEYRRTGASSWTPTHTLGTNPVPTYEETTGMTVYRSAATGRNGTVAASPGDRVTYVSTSAPFTTQDHALWLDSANDHKPLYRDGNIWKAFDGAVKTTNGTFKVWTWSERSSWGTDKATKAFVGPTPAPRNREQGDFWLNTVSGTVYFFNGSAWIVAGSSLDPADLAGVDGDQGDDDITINNGEVHIKGKTTSAFVLELRIPVDNYDGTYDVRVTKVTAANTTEKMFDVTWESFQELSAKAFKFPGLATAHLMGRASDQFSSMPNFSGIYRGRIIKVPSNYNPTARTYSGSWDGTWKLAWSDNPAYVCNDLVENDRYGMNAYYPVTLNKWDVYDAGQWCDARTTDGKPRFTFNKLLQDPMGGREAIEYICGIFGGRFFDDGNGSAVIRIDRDGDPVQLFAPENVVDGLFVYSFTEIQSRFNDITVSFINPELNYQEDRRRLSDEAYVLKHGRVPHNFIAVGCNSAEEAIVRTRYKLVTAITENRLVSFKTNRKGLYLAPYDVILIADDEMASGLSGRVKEVIGSNSFSLRDPIYLEPGVNYRARFELVNAAGTFETVTRNLPAGINGTLSTIQVTSALPTLPENAVFAIETTDSSAVPQAYRVTNIAEVDGDPDNVEISAVLMNRLKWGYVDGTLPLEATVERYDVKSREKPKRVRNLRIQPNTQEVGLSIGSDLIVDWDVPNSIGIQKYTVSVSRNNGPFAVIAETFGPKFEWNDVPDGEYQIQVCAVNVFGNSSRPVTISHRLLGDVRDTLDVLNIRLVDEPFLNIFESRSPRFAWTSSVLKSHRDYLVQVIDTSSVVVYETSTTGHNFTWEFDLNAVVNGGTAKRAFSVRVASRDAAGRTSSPSTISVNNPAPAAPAVITKSVNWMSVTLQADPPTARDIQGMMVWSSVTPNFTPTDGNRVYNGPNNNVSLEIEPGTTRYYRFAFYDVFGVSTLNYSDQVTVVAPANPVLDLIAPAKPTGLTLTSVLQTDNTVLLRASWNPNSESDLAFYDFQIKEGNGNWVSIVTSANNWERVVQSATLYTARVAARDVAGNISPFSDQFSHTTTKDNVAPGLPSGVTVTGSFNTLWVKWTASTAADLAFYEVYEGNSATPAPTTETTPVTVVGGTTYLRSGLGNGVTSYFWVRSVDFSGNRSAWTGVASGTTTNITIPDISPQVLGAPGAPTLATTLTQNPDGATVSTLVANWAAGTNAVSYEVSVTEAGVETIVPAAGLSLGLKVRPGILYTLKVRSIGSLGNKSVYSAAASSTPGGDAVAPNVPGSLVCTSGLKSFWLTWSPVSATDLAFYEVYVGINSTAPSAGTAATGQVRGTTYYTPALAGDQRWFWIRAVDLSGNKSAWSTVAFGTAGNITAVDVDAVIANTSYAVSIEAPKVVSALPTASTYTASKKVYLTTDKVIYVKNAAGTAWVAETDATLLVGQITAGQLAVGAVGADQIQSNAISAKHLLITDIQNVVMNGAFSSGDAAGWDNLAGAGGAAYIAARGSAASTAINSMPGPFALIVQYTTPTFRFYANNSAVVQCAPGDQFLFMVDAARSGNVPNNSGQFRVQWQAADGTVLASDNSFWNGLSTTWQTFTYVATAPAGAVGMRPTLQFNGSTDWSSASGYMLVTNYAVRRRNKGELIVDGSIRANHLTTTSAVITGTIQIADAIITDAKIVSLQAKQITVSSDGTGLNSGITIGVTGTTIGTVEARASDPAARINAAATTILPGRILVSAGNSTTLDSLITSGTTTINGGKITADSIGAKSLNIASRGVFVEGLEFEHNKPTTNSLSWTSGTIRYTDNSGNTVSTTVAAGAATWASGVLYIYWTIGSTTLSSTTVPGTANANNAVCFAAYLGGTNLVATYGRTVIDGDGIKTNTIDTYHLKAQSITAAKLVLSDFNNLVPSGDFASSDWSSNWTWSAGTGTVAETTSAHSGSRAILFDKGGTEGSTGGANIYMQTADPFPVEGGQSYLMEASVLPSGGTTPAGFYLRVYWFTATGEAASVAFFDTQSNAGLSSGWSIRGGSVVAPDDARTCRVRIYHYNTSTSRYLTVDRITFKRMDAQRLIVDGGIFARMITVDGDFVAKLATIQTAYITDANISGTLNANKITAGTALVDTITVGGASLSTIRNGSILGAQDPATRINSAATTIDPGKIRISGSAVLSSWIKGGDETRIDGGMISANTIKANSLDIGSRNVTLEGFVFDSNNPAANRASWTAGTIRWTNDTNVITATSVVAGSTAVWTTGTIYIYWVKGATTLSSTTAAATAFAANNLVVATYKGGVTIDPDYGRTLIDGSTIKTNTITATQISVISLSAISANLGAITGGSININNRFIVGTDGTVTIKSAATGARLEINNSLVQVFDAAGTLRVRLGIW